MSFVLKNSTAPQGRKPSKEESKDAVEEATSTFGEFKRTLCPEFKALNASDLALSNIIAELAPKVSLNLKLHYRRLKEALKTKLSMDCSGLPTTGQDGTEAGDDTAAADMGEDVDDGDDDNDSATKLSKILLLSWVTFNSAGINFSSCHHPTDLDSASKLRWGFLHGYQ
ncbi:hypothetical protein FBU30_004615 [Linnemannia zychae]|nr:hypothetical protein FBU30_004615 [Linnemannia zychae]